MMIIKKIIIVAPFWGLMQHVGVYRVDRFVRWLIEEGIEIVMVSAGRQDKVEQMPWGVEISIRDPLGLYGNNSNLDKDIPSRSRRPNRIRRLASYILLPPDPGVIWARRAACHSLVLEYGNGANWVISSSPPESAHIGSSMLARRLGAKLIVDMRDGWLDEPLKTLLKISRIQYWREGIMEKRILQQAGHIFVTSDVWKDLLEKRLKTTKGKITVLTNAYPSEIFQNAIKKVPFNTRDQKTQKCNQVITLIHAGRFTGSRSTQKVSCLLKPLLEGLKDVEQKGRIILLGSLESQDIDEVVELQQSFASIGWIIELVPVLPRNEMMKRLNEADGLLLLSASMAAIPSKLFEYLCTGRPIFTATIKDSAVWRIGVDVPQIYQVDYTQSDMNNVVIRDFINACLNINLSTTIPEKYSEEYLCRKFIEVLDL